MFQKPDKNDVFRKAALDRLSSPEELDQLMQVTTPQGWLALLALGVLIVVALIWGFWGNIPTKVQGTGILLKAEGAIHVAAMTAGQVEEIYVTVGDIVVEGQTVARISPAASGSSQGARVISPQDGRVTEIRTTVGSVVNLGSPIISMEALNRDSQTLEALIYIPANDAKKVRAGMIVEMTPSVVKREEYGFIPGQVTWVSAFPATQQGMLRTLGSEELAKQFGQQGAVFEVRASLAQDSGSPSGYHWSSKGPNVTIENGTPGTAQVVTEQRRPISLVIPLFKEWFLTGPLFKQ